MFRLNIDTKANNWNDLVSLGVHSKDGTLECNTMRYPQYEKMVTMNDGRSFQTGCGVDPPDTRCCYKDNRNKNKPSSNYRCVVLKITIMAVTFAPFIRYSAYISGH